MGGTGSASAIIGEVSDNTSLDLFELLYYNYSGSSTKEKLVGVYWGIVYGRGKVRLSSNRGSG